jgi:hypothetical protein
MGVRARLRPKASARNLSPPTLLADKQLCVLWGEQEHAFPAGTFTPLRRPRRFANSALIEQTDVRLGVKAALFGRAPTGVDDAQ